MFAFSSADAEVLPDAFADGYAEDGMERSERGDVIVLAADRSGCSSPRAAAMSSP